MAVEWVDKNELISVIENEAKLQVDSFIESAIELGEEVHSDVKREDEKSPFLETHIWPVTIDVIRHYKMANRPLTTLQIVSSILHDVMEDNDKILDLHTSKSYGFDAYFVHRFGDYVYKVANTLKTKPLELYQSKTKDPESERFRQYCANLASSDYDIKTIKLADRFNNMKFISQIPDHEKIKRYLREAEDFYLAYPIIPPRIDDFYFKIREAYDELKGIKVTI